MKYEGDIGLYLSGAQVPIPQCGIFIEQPKIKQIVQVGEANFLTALQILSDTSTFVSQIKKGNSQLEEYNDFQVLLVVIKQDQSVQSYIEAFFELVCPTYKLTFQKNSIEFTLKEDEDNTSIKGVLNPFNYEYFSKVIKELFGIERSVTQIRVFLNKHDVYTVRSEKMLFIQRQRIINTLKKNKDY